MKAAYENGIAGPGNVWIVSDGLSESYLDGRRYEEGSPLAIASQGVGILKAEGGRATSGDDQQTKSGYDRFSEAWYSQGSDNIDYYNCKQPKNNTIGDPSIYFMAPHDFFTGHNLPPTAGAVFSYDSAIAFGLAACELYNERGDAYFNGYDLYQRFVSQSFEGASGQVTIDPKTTSRDPTSAFFVLYNANGVSDREGGTVFSVKTVANSAPNPESTSVQWVNYNNAVYVYSDGSTVPPDDLPPAEVELNQLTTGIRAVGFTVVALVFFLGLYFAIWTKMNRSNRVVKASQPEFLYMICSGAIILGSTIIPLSYDDAIASPSGCDTACMSVSFETVFYKSACPFVIFSTCLV